MAAELERTRAAVDADLRLPTPTRIVWTGDGRAEEAAEARHSAALARAQVARDRAIADARAESAARAEAVRQSGADEREVREALAGEQVRLAADVARARIAYDDDVAAAEEETDQARLDRLDRYAQRAREVAEVVVDGLLASLGGTDDLARAEVDLRRAAYLEQERDLEQSLRRRQISQEEHAQRLKEIELDRTRFERDVQDQNAGFFVRSYRGIRDIALAAVRDYAAGYLASKAAELLVHTTTEEGKTVVTLAGTAARGAALLAEGASAVFNAAASVVSAVATQIKQIVSAIPFPFNLAAIPVGIAAVTGAYLGAKKLFFAEGGYVGRRGERGRDEVEIVVGRGEAILNHHQQKVVDESLKQAGRGGLGQLFRDERRPHYRYETGGLAGFAPLLSSPGQASVRRISGQAEGADAAALPNTIGAAVAAAVAPLADEVARLKTQPPAVYADPKTFRRGQKAASADRSQTSTSRVRRIQIQRS